tara:strand:- start:15420 stop:15548 length:129 start_codon:yes stop_codon:yes gene_type:complete
LDLFIFSQKEKGFAYGHFKLKISTFLESFGEAKGWIERKKTL